jgi:hypothetical protein
VHESGPRLRCRPAIAAAGFWLDAPLRATEAAGEFLGSAGCSGGSDPESAWTCLCGGDYAALVFVGPAHHGRGYRAEASRGLAGPYGWVGRFTPMRLAREPP